MQGAPVITFRKTKPRIWAGNGFGYSPAQYEVLRNGEHAGTLMGTGTRWYGNLIDGERIRSDYFREARRDIINHYRRARR